MENTTGSSTTVTNSSENSLSSHKQINLDKSQVKTDTSAQSYTSNKAPDNLYPSISPETATTPPNVNQSQVINTAAGLAATKIVQPQSPVSDSVNQQYFLPINTASQKKSIKISLGLTLLIFLLAIILIDLMLDSGMILLVQKLPHTHIFNTYVNR